jgi:hypothetical protein
VCEASTGSSSGASDIIIPSSAGGGFRVRFRRCPCGRGSAVIDAASLSSSGTSGIAIALIKSSTTKVWVAQLIQSEIDLNLRLSASWPECGLQIWINAGLFSEFLPYIIRTPRTLHQCPPWFHHVFVNDRILRNRKTHSIIICIINTIICIIRTWPIRAFQYDFSYNLYMRA